MLVFSPGALGAFYRALAFERRRMPYKSWARRGEGERENKEINRKTWRVGKYCLTRLL